MARRYNHTDIQQTTFDGAIPQPLSVIEVQKLLGAEGHGHPHDALMLANGDLINVCWGGPDTDQGPAIGTMSYWRHIK